MEGINHPLVVVYRVVWSLEVQKESQGQPAASVAGGQVCTGAWVLSLGWLGT